ncbi:MAG: GSU2403 family nucleotidyltransferase fold protein [Pseudomonadota bacterium]
MKGSTLKIGTPRIQRAEGSCRRPRRTFKVEFQTANRGSDDQAGKPITTPALGGAFAFPLRFLDCLIHQPIRAVLLHDVGVPLLISAPERYDIQTDRGISPKSR